MKTQDIEIFSRVYCCLNKKILTVSFFNSHHRRHRHHHLSSLSRGFHISVLDQTVYNLKINYVWQICDKM